MNNYGITHGMVCAAIMAFIHFVPRELTAIIAGLWVSGYYYNRERTARLRDNVRRFRDWYLDSQCDAVLAFVVWVIYVCLVFYYAYYR